MPTLDNGGLSGISLLPGKSNLNCGPFAAFCFWHVKELLSTLQRAARPLKIQYFVSNWSGHILDLDDPQTNEHP